MKERIEIPLSRKKNIMLSLGAAIFVALGVLFLLTPAEFSTGNRSIGFVKVVGIISTIFFGLCLVFIVKKIFDSKPGLIIDADGITDNSSATSIGFIDWNDVYKVKVLKMNSVTFFMIMTDDPQKYIHRGKNILLKSSMRMNYRLYGSPISISSTSLRIKHNELMDIFIDALKKRNIEFT